MGRRGVVNAYSYNDNDGGGGVKFSDKKNRHRCVAGLGSSAAAENAAADEPRTATNGDGSFISSGGGGVGSIHSKICSSEANKSSSRRA